MVDIAIDAGFRPLSIGSASRAEWAEFESGHIRAAAEAHRDQWLRGYRDVLGFSYLIIGRSA